MSVESAAAGPARGTSLEVRMLGPLTIVRDGVVLPMPASRKVRALLAYLALAPRPVTRSHLCELLWDVPNDPRGELRWCLSKIRSVIERDGVRRVASAGDTVRLDLADCTVDAITVSRAAQAGIATIETERLRALAGLFAGEFLDGLEIDRSPAFGAWLIAERRRFRSCRAALLEHLAEALPDDDAIGYLEQWVALAPFDRRAHEGLLGALARRGRRRDAAEHLQAATRLFESEGLDCAPLRVAWGSIRADGDAAPAMPAKGIDGEETAGAGARRASVAVMPFVDRSGTSATGGGSADGLAHDVITRLAKLRSLFVIAQGTVFALHERRIGPEEAGRMLNVDYVVGGTVQRHEPRLVVTVELIETRTARVVWAESFTHRTDEALAMLDEIGDRIVASVAGEIEMIERNRAILLPPNSLDAWQAHHRGLWHMYRFNRADNALARQFFEIAVRLDPTFSRAYAGLSFTHFQNAFQGWAKRCPESDRAFAAAEQGLMADDRDPAAHWAMGRALWLRGSQDRSIAELETAVNLSPNFALGHYTLAFVHSQAGDAAAAIQATDLSQKLSPFDPMLFGMLGARAMALVRQGRFDEAAECGVRAAARPNAHAHIYAIAAYCLALAGRLEEARDHMAALGRTRPRYCIDDFLTAMRLAPDAAAMFRDGARRIAGSAQ